MKSRFHLLDAVRHLRRRCGISRVVLLVAGDGARSCSWTRVATGMATKTLSFSSMVLKNTSAVVSARGTVVRLPPSLNLTFKLKHSSCLHTCSMAASGAVMLGTREIRGHRSPIEAG